MFTLRLKSVPEGGGLLRLRSSQTRCYLVCCYLGEVSDFRVLGTSCQR